MNVTGSRRSRLCDDRIYQVLLFSGRWAVRNAIVPVQKSTCSCVPDRESRRAFGGSGLIQLCRRRRAGTAASRRLCDEIGADTHRRSARVQRAAYLETAVESVLAQSFRDLELIVSDNASTDDTEAIGRPLAARDPRVTYRRNARNVGLSENFNLLVPLARADLTDPAWHLVADDPSERLPYAILAGHYVNPALGVIRTDALRRTRLLPRYAGGDYRLMAELSVLGKFVEIPEPLYVRRIHGGSTGGNTGNTTWLRTYWSGSRPGMHCPCWRLCRDHAGILMRGPIPLARKAVPLAQLARTMLYQWRRLICELVGALRA